MHSEVVDPETAPSHIVISVGSCAIARGADKVASGASNAMARMRTVLMDFRIEDSSVERRVSQPADPRDAGDAADALRCLEFSSRFAGVHLLERVARASRALPRRETERQRFTAVLMSQSCGFPARGE